jgi:hypothetical protein
METKQITTTDIKEFQNYCLEFYGKNGIYFDELKGGVSPKLMSKAIKIYFLSMNDLRTWGGGDSLDRERVRQILEILV